MNWNGLDYELRRITQGLVILIALYLILMFVVLLLSVSWHFIVKLW